MPETVVLEGNRLRISFLWHKDRYAHTIGVIESGRLLPLLASLEGTSDEQWPSCPPLQQLEMERGVDRQLALLVGMAGRNHWSASVALDAGHDKARFEVACRMKQLPRSAHDAGTGSLLGSEYRTMLPPVIQSSMARLETDCGNVQISAHSDSNATGSTKLELTSGGLRIVPGQEEADLPHTVQWSYEVAVVPQDS